MIGMHGGRRRPRVAFLFFVTAIVIFLYLATWQRHSLDHGAWRPWSWPGVRMFAPLDEPPPFPKDYDLSEDQAMCHTMFGPGYIKHIETHQHPYCEPSSSSFLQCFSAPRLPPPWMSMWSHERGDPICIARGVFYDPTSELHFKAHCNARDFAGEFERMSPEDKIKNEALRHVPDLSQLDEYWGQSGVGGEFNVNWQFNESVPRCSHENNNGEWLYVIRREGTPNVWHRVMDVWQALITLDAMQVARNPATGKPWMTEEDVKSMRVVFDNTISPDGVDDWWRMLNGQAPSQVDTLPAGTCYGNVLLPLAGSSSPFWAALAENVYHEPCQEQFLINAFRARVFRHLGIPPPSLHPPPNVEPVITLINRTHNRILHEADNLMEKVRRRYPNSKVNVADFATLGLREQVELAMTTDVLIGHHGAGMTHLFFLPPDAAVIELTSNKTRKFRSVTRLRGIAHFETDVLEGPEYEHLVHGKPIPHGWMAGMEDDKWQSRKFAYVLEEEFLATVDAAVRNQRNRRYH